MSVQQTSILAWQKMQPKLALTQEIVLAAIKELGNATDKEIGEYLGWTINRVTNRRGELVLKGKVQYAYHTARNGTTEMTWEVIKEESQ